MTTKKRSVTITNAFFSLLLQLVTIASGFIIPRLILQTFGSETNGLISSLTQFLNYITLVEGGITGVLMANLYRPLRKRDYEKVSSIVSAASSFYKKMGYILVVYSIILSIVYPLIVHTSFSLEYVCTLTLILSFNLCIQYFFALSIRTLLRADKKVAFVSVVQIISIILNTALTALVITFLPNIHLVKLLASFAFILQPIAFGLYARKHYPLRDNSKPDTTVLKQRWSALGINIAAFIHNNTDIFILTIFMTLPDVSIYAVYALVTTGLKRVIQAISEGISPTLGHAYASDDKKRLHNVFAKYESVIYIASFYLFTVGAILITPFVQIYTAGINDANYYQPLFGLLLIIGELIFCIREPYVNMAYSANKFKEISKHAYIESAINIILSILLVQKLGLIGVAIGTVSAMAYRTAFQIFYLKEHILFLKIKQTVMKILAFLIASCIGAFISIRVLNITTTTYSIETWLLHGIISSIIILVCLAPVSLYYLKIKKNNEK